MSRGKPVQTGVRAKLPAGTSWDALAALSPDQIRDRDLFPRGFLPLPHPNHAEGGMVFPHFEIDELKKQEAATSPASTSISTCRITCCRSFRRRFI